MSNLTLFRRGVEALQPGATGTDLVELLDGKAKRTTALQWYAGRWHAPQWALDLLANKIEARYENVLHQLRSAPPRPGKQAGTLNLLRWRGTRRS